MKKYIYFKGYHGNQNIGDDIFVIVADWICSDLFKELSFTPVFFGNHLPIVSKSAINIKRKGGLRGKFQELILCFKAKSIIFFGGSVFTGYTFNKYGSQSFLNRIPLLNKKLGAIGTSIGPFSSKEDYRFTNEFLSKFKFIAVRDYKSMELAREMEIEDKTKFCFDPAILINKLVQPNEKTTTKGNKITIGVSLCHYERYVGGDLEKEKYRENAVEKFLMKITDESHEIDEVIFFVFNGNSSIGDYEMTREFYDKIKSRVKTRIINYTSDTIKFVECFSKCDYIFGIRLHSGILAYSLNIPFTLVEYHQKCTDFLDAIKYDQSYRFSIENQNKNIKNYNNIKNDNIEGLIDKEYFAHTMIDEVKYILRNHL